MTLAIYCAGGLGKEVIALARSVSRWDSIIFVDDVTKAEWHADAKVYRFEQLKDYPDDVEFVIASGEPAGREKLYYRIKEAGYPMATIYGPGFTMLPGTSIGEGCILYDCGISADVTIEPNVIINTKAVIGHDSYVGAHSVMSFVSFIGGNSAVGSRTYIAPGAMIKDHIKVGNDCIISMGAIVLRNVKDSSIMVGNPARRLGENTEKRVFGIFNNKI